MLSHFPLFKVINLLVVLTLLGVISPGRNPVQASQSSEPPNVIEGSGGNQVADGVSGGTISGGGQAAFPNQILKDFGVIDGGRGNIAGNFSTVGGGEANDAEGIRATIGGGAHNTASRNNAVVAGGFGNTASQSYATVSGGTVNIASGSYTTVSGGSGNLAAGRISTVGGGTRNQAQSAYSTIGGGTYNLAIGGTSTIGGGTGNRAPGIGSTIGGGAGNNVAGLESTITGGLSNKTTDNYSAVAGGRENVAGNGNSDPEDKPYASVSGGYENQAGGAYSAVPGGYGNQALGDYSFAAGNQAQVEAGHPGVFLFADSNDSAFKSTAPNEFAARATGGVRFVTAIDGNGAPLAGVRLAPGSGTWESLSDRNAKTAILPVDGRQVLNALMNIPVSTWQYIGQPGAVQHMGPMAQDFYAAFGLGQDEHYIGAVDAEGVALASIQGLNQIVQEKDARIASLEAQNADQEKRLDDFEARLTNLEKHSGQPTSQPYGLWLGIVSLVIGLAVGRYLLAPRGVS
jgi:trimeric autotransporter adhesin